MRVSQPSGVHRVHPARCSEGLLYIMDDTCRAKVYGIRTPPQNTQRTLLLRESDASLGIPALFIWWLRRKSKYICINAG